MTYVAWKIDTANGGTRLTLIKAADGHTCVCVCERHEGSKNNIDKYRKQEADRLCVCNVQPSSCVCSRLLRASCFPLCFSLVLVSAL